MWYKIDVNNFVQLTPRVHSTIKEEKKQWRQKKKIKNLCGKPHGVFLMLLDDNNVNFMDNKRRLGLIQGVATKCVIKKESIDNSRKEQVHIVPTLTPFLVNETNVKFSCTIINFNKWGKKTLTLEEMHIFGDSQRVTLFGFVSMFANQSISKLIAPIFSEIIFKIEI